MGKRRHLKNYTCALKSVFPQISKEYLRDKTFEHDDLLCFKPDVPSNYIEIQKLNFLKEFRESETVKCKSQVPESPRHILDSHS